MNVNKKFNIKFAIITQSLYRLFREADRTDGRSVGVTDGCFLLTKISFHNTSIYVFA